MLALTFLQMHWSFLAFDAWCFYYIILPWVSEKQPILAEQAVHQYPWFSWIPQRNAFRIGIFLHFSPIYIFSIGILGMPVQRFCGIRYAGCCTMLMQNAAPFYASKTNLSGANCRSTTLWSEISLQLLHSRLHNRLIPVVQRSLLEKSGGKCFRFRTAAALHGLVSVVSYSLASVKRRCDCSSQKWPDVRWMGSRLAYTCQPRDLNFKRILITSPHLTHLWMEMSNSFSF